MFFGINKDGTENEFSWPRRNRIDSFFTFCWIGES
jgi:hypothetical protein